MTDFLPDHLQLAHQYWQTLLSSKDNVIDATCGNGKDSLFLAQIIKEGKIFSFDIQKKAIKNAQDLFQKNKISGSNISFILSSHEDFSNVPKLSIKLIVYNLGYLPGGDKSITTKKASTLKSIESALETIENGGALSISCYSGHEEGKEEEEAILDYVSNLELDKYQVIIHHWNKKNAPTLIWIVKK